MSLEIRGMGESHQSILHRRARADISRTLGLLAQVMYLCVPLRLCEGIIQFIGHEGALRFQETYTLRFKDVGINLKKIRRCCKVMPCNCDMASRDGCISDRSFFLPEND